MENKIYIKMDPRDIIYLDNIMEGFDGLGIVSTGNPKTGEVYIHVTPDTRDEVLEILQNFPRPLVYSLDREGRGENSM
ncbi:peptidase, U32 family protein [Thermincola ferriacetica]|uniref:Peptidase, U32 family protein n=3 Tax=Thermincola TaxID=278993 RepID=D5X822_THEPJ|nr:DUF4911 domain-containing protein [Thermincola ferriacetica]ADG82742.1 peptidase, U32 family protein [Thermincola potens JR]KNZ70197.1 peptidase, U32 family protein [Thermincola ferriacetica]